MTTKHETWQKAAQAWKDGDNVWSVELGGIGPGYEQAIQVLLWEIMARWEGEAPKPDGEKYPRHYNEHVDSVVSDLNEACGGFTGAQVCAARATAFQFMHYGYKHMMGKLPNDRWILVSKSFPHVEAKP